MPLSWSGTAPPYGFSADGVEPWLPQPREFGGLIAEAQAGRPDSMLTLYRTALAQRRELGLGVQDFAWLESPDEVIAFSRGASFVCLVNLGTHPVPLPVDGRVLVSSVALEGDGLLPPDAAAWVTCSR